AYLNPAIQTAGSNLRRTVVTQHPTPQGPSCLAPDSVPTRPLRFVARNLTSARKRLTAPSPRRTHLLFGERSPMLARHMPEATRVSKTTTGATHRRVAAPPCRRPPRTPRRTDERAARWRESTMLDITRIGRRAERGPASRRRRSVLTTLALIAGGLTGAAAATLAAAPAAVADPAPPPPSGWTTVFSDDFSGAAGSAPSAANWFYDIGTGYGTGEKEQTTSSTSNVYLDGNGHLVLKAINSGGTWTSGRIESTRDDFQAPPGGELEMTASIQQPNPASGLGYWPAFWALGSPMRAGGGWPQSGEIDMMEDVNGLNQASQTLHDSANSPGHALIACPGAGSTCQTGYHTYSVIIDRTNTSAEQMQFLMDDVVESTITESSVGTA